MSEPARTTPRTAARPAARTTTARTTARATARTATARTATARTATARSSTARPTSRATTGPVHVTRSVPSRRTGPVATGPQLRLVPPGRTAPARTSTRARRTARRRAPFVVLLVGLLITTTLGLLLNTAIAVDSLDVSHQRAANADQAEQVARLEQQVIAADAAAELARRAASAGLVPPGAAAHLVLQPDGTSVLLGTAVPAPDPTNPDQTTPGN